MENENVIFDFDSAFEGYLSSEPNDDPNVTELEACEEYNSSFEEGYQEALEFYDLLDRMDATLESMREVSYEDETEYSHASVYGGSPLDDAYNEGYQMALNDFGL